MRAPSTTRATLFQFPPLREGRQVLSRDNRARDVFQFPPLREGRLKAVYRIACPVNFNSRPCARGDERAMSRLI